MPIARPSAAAHYRALALDAYATAKLIEDPHNRRIMERVALGYENLAANAEARARAAELVASIVTPDEKTSPQTHQESVRMNRPLLRIRPFAYRVTAFS
jgi:hypothetical protein